MHQKTKRLIRLLQQKKYRKEEQCFVVEGAKSVLELLSSDFTITTLTATADFLRQHERKIRKPGIEIDESTEKDLAAAGSLQSNNAAIAVAQMKPNRPPNVRGSEYVVALDDIRDPGNAGTIIRTADWYGIRHLVASEETADFYNAKTILASMGSFTRVSVYYTALPEYLASVQQKKYGAFLDGADVHTVRFAAGGVIVIGNESNGISPRVCDQIDEKITIPRYGGAESLNAGLSTAIILDNLRRSQE